MWDRFEVCGSGPIPVTGWRDNANDAGDLAAHYLRAGWSSVTITDKESDE